jgi:pimeloyl-ACP methyl ester carboxylesterase
MAKRGDYREEPWETPDPEGGTLLSMSSLRLASDAVGNARLLIRKLEALRTKLKKPELKFDIVGHSMGGLLARYAAMYGDVDLPVWTHKATADVGRCRIL